MTEVLTSADEVYRDYVVDGVPASGPWTPDNEDILGLWETLDSLLTALMTAGGVTVEDTLAHLNANLVPAAPAFAQVVADGSNNGWYTKTGATGVGAWTFLNADPAVAAAAAAAASATAAAASAVTASDALSSLDAVVAQQIGRPVDPVTGTGIGSGTLLWATTAAGPAVLQSLKIWAAATGTLKIAAYSISGSAATRTANTTVTISATGAQTFTAADFGVFDVPAGGMVALSGAGLVASGVEPAGPGDKFWEVADGCPSSATLAVDFTTIPIEAQWNLEVTEQVVNVAAFQAVQAATGGGGALTLSNVDKIVIVSNSYWEAAYALLGKGPPCNISMLSEYNWGNFSEGAQSAPQLMAKMVNGTTEFGALFGQLGATWALLGEWGNTFSQGATDAEYAADITQWIQQARGLGAVPLLMSELWNPLNGGADGQQSGLKTLRQVADATGTKFFDITSKSRTMDPALYAAFWESDHPATRMCHLITDRLRPQLAQVMPRPLQSMKIFRVRGTVSVSGPASLMFETVQQRAALFKEIYIGHMALSTAYETYYDTAIALYTSTQVQADEYLELVAGSAVALGDYALVDLVLPSLNPQNLQLTLSDTAVSVYARQMLNGVNTWIQLDLDPTDTFFVVPPPSVVPGLVDNDRLALLLYKSAGVSLDASPQLTWSSGAPKLRQFGQLPIPPQGPELLAAPFTAVAGAVPGAWTNAGALPAIVPIDGAAYLPGADLSPPLTTGCVEVTIADGLAQPFAYAASDDPQEIVVRVWARRWVAVTASGGTFSTYPITLDTFDMGTLQVTLSGADGPGHASATFTDLVGLAWNELEFRCTLQPYITTGVVDVRSADVTLQIAKVSVRLAQ